MWYPLFQFEFSKIPLSKSASTIYASDISTMLPNFNGPEPVAEMKSYLVGISQLVFKFK